MVGNAAEEGLMQQVGNPSHADVGRIIVPASAVAGIVSAYTLLWLFPRLTPWAGIVIGTLVCIVVAWRLALWFQRRRNTRLLAENLSRRAAQVAETERQIAVMQRQTREAGK